MNLNNLQQKIVIYALNNLIKTYENDLMNLPKELQIAFKLSLKNQYSVLNKIENNISQISIAEIAEINDACITLQEDIELNKNIINDIKWCSNYELEKELNNIIRQTNKIKNSFI